MPRIRGRVWPCPDLEATPDRLRPTPIQRGDASSGTLGGMPSADELRRLEEIALNASGTARQILYDGWIVRLSAGKAKRARSINPFYPSRLPLDDKLARCDGLYREHGLPLLVRVTPFVDPPGLDDQLEARGFVKFETTWVMTRPLDGVGAAAPPGVASCEMRELVDAVSELRQASEVDRTGHLERLGALPLARRGFVIRDGGAPVCAGLLVIEPPCAGLFDVVTAVAHRGRGLATVLTAAMLHAAATAGATTAYLQVDAENAPARAVYERAGFVDRYAYWYRRAPP
jgi:ribosomal protein S18 acetylase RimI-like enzyme